MYCPAVHVATYVCNEIVNFDLHYIGEYLVIH